MTVVDTRPTTALVVAPTLQLPVPGDAWGEASRPVHHWPSPCLWAVTDPDDIDGIRERVKYHRAPWWWRLTRPRPPEPTHLTLALPPALPVAPSPLGEVA